METDRLRIWCLPVAVVGALGIFTATFFTYAELHHKGWGSPTPMVAGISAFALAMLIVTFLMLPKAMSKVRKTITTLVIVAIETIAFIYAIFFLLLNIYGS